MALIETGDGEQEVVAKGPERVLGRLEAALARAEQAEALYDSLIQHLPAITYTEALEDGRTLAISPQVETVLGYTQEEWMGNALLWVELLHPDDRDRVVEACETANRNREPYRAEFRMIARSGRVVWIREEATLVWGSQGEPLCWQGVMFDISRQKEAEGIRRLSPDSER